MDVRVKLTIGQTLTLTLTDDDAAELELPDYAALTDALDTLRHAMLDGVESLKRQSAATSRLSRAERELNRPPTAQ